MAVGVSGFWVCLHRNGLDLIKYGWKVNMTERNRFNRFSKRSTAAKTPPDPTVHPLHSLRNICVPRATKPSFRSEDARSVAGKLDFRLTQT